MLSLLLGVTLPALQRRAHGNRREHHISRRPSTIGRIHARRRSKDDDDGEGNDNNYVNIQLSIDREGSIFLVPAVVLAGRELCCGQLHSHGGRWGSGTRHRMSCTSYCRQTVVIFQRAKYSSSACALCVHACACAQARSNAKCCSALLCVRAPYRFALSLGCNVAVVVVLDVVLLAAGADPNGRCSEAEEEALGFIRQSERSDRRGRVDLCGCRPCPHRAPPPSIRRSPLLSRGEDPRSRSALSLALAAGHVATAVFLIEHGAACDGMAEEEAEALGRLEKADQLPIREAIDSRVQLK